MGILYVYYHELLHFDKTLLLIFTCFIVNLRPVTNLSNEIGTLFTIPLMTLIMFCIVLRFFTQKTLLILTTLQTNLSNLFHRKRLLKVRKKAYRHRLFGVIIFPVHDLIKE